jgi:hypothetical protein
MKETLFEEDRATVGLKLNCPIMLHKSCAIITYFVACTLLKEQSIVHAIQTVLYLWQMRNLNFLISKKKIILN